MAGNGATHRNSVEANIRSNQKVTPRGWHPRTTDLPKFVYNTRRMWKHEMKRALQELDELPADAAPDVRDKAKYTLMAWFRRM